MANNHHTSAHVKKLFSGISHKHYHLKVTKHIWEEVAHSYISTSHLESPEKSQTRPGWTLRTQCAHPIEWQEREKQRRWASYICCTFLSSFLWGQTFCSKSAAISAQHLALYLGINMSPLVISKIKATGSYSKSYSCSTQTMYILRQRHFIYSCVSTSWLDMIIVSDKVENLPLWHFFPLFSALLEFHTMNLARRRSKKN